MQIPTTALPRLRTATSTASSSLQSIPSIDVEVATSLEPLEKRYLTCGEFEKWQQDRRSHRREVASELLAASRPVDLQAAASLQPMRPAYLSTADFALWREARRQSADARRSVDHCRAKTATF